MSKRRDNIGRKKGWRDIINWVDYRASEDEGDSVDVVTHFGDQLCEVVQRLPLLA